ncbi:hypothetical protein PF005_g30064 [Phytophthora fragariae]|uniref:ZSWIM1/3 RNaseH-like domain-containing protein n=1 Tax=Phytophthora fragariae TaxID=53985 RepID=A0A6A3VDC0_9STRA|nr:hypothetical protein PF005_g30064 [Phytophthora fragariae]
MSDVELLVNSGSKPSRIYDYIRDNSIHRVKMRDVYNIVTRVKAAGNELSDEDQVAELLVNFNLQAEGNVSTVNENARGQTAVISISSQHMRKLYHRFPELLLIDCTHKTNRHNYQLCTLMVMDQFGNGQPVQHSVIERNADWHMVKTVEHFQAVNDWEATRVIVVDKDLKEIEVLTRMFPDARILLCHFHVIKWLASAVRDDKKFDTYPSEVLKQIDHCVANMVWAKTDSDFQNHTEESKLLACRGGREALWTYFNKNWWAKKEMWVTAFRMHLPHFRNNTNNRLENFFGKLKADLDGSFSMKDCLKTILNFQRRKEDEYHTKVMMPGTIRNANYGEEMNQFLGMTSDWLADIFFAEYQFATDAETIALYSFEERQDRVHVSRDGRVHRVNTSAWLCDCEFSSTMKLPCHHVLLYRKHVGDVFTIPYSSLHSR